MGLETLKNRNSLRMIRRGPLGKRILVTQPETILMKNKLKPAKLNEIRSRLGTLASPERARDVARFFKTGPGEYAEGDRFLGITMPEIRKLAREVGSLSATDHDRLLRSAWHEERMLALVIWSNRYPKSSPKERSRITRKFLGSMKYINNWDLIDVNTPLIVGTPLARGDEKLLRRLRGFLKSSNLWKRRVALLATFQCIREGDTALTLSFAAEVLRDPEDLIHKASGWMLREAGKTDIESLRRFLREHHLHMPRTMLRYAIEKLSPPERKKWMTGGGRVPRQRSAPDRPTPPKKSGEPLIGAPRKKSNG